jgi:hypothetical protein
MLLILLGKLVKGIQDVQIHRKSPRKYAVALDLNQTACEISNRTGDGTRNQARAWRVERFPENDAGIQLKLAGGHTQARWTRRLQRKNYTEQPARDRSC